MSRFSRLLRRSVVLGVLCCLGLACAESQPDSEPRAALTVLVTVAPQAELVERIAGDLVKTVILVPPGADPHTYEPSVSQLRAVSEAGAYFLIGHPYLEFERFWLRRLQSDRTDLRLIVGAKGLDVSGPDPHMWLSPTALKVLTRNLTEGLIAWAPQHQKEFEKGRDDLMARIDELDAQLQSVLGRHAGRSFLVFHGAWGWFAEEYDLNQIAIEQGHHHPGPGQVAKLMERARLENINVIFVEPREDVASAREMAREFGASVVRLDPLAPDLLQNLRRAGDQIDAAMTETRK